MDCNKKCCKEPHHSVAGKKGSYDTTLDKADRKWECIGIGGGAHLIDPCHDCTDKTVMEACTKLSWDLALSEFTLERKQKRAGTWGTT